MCRTRPRVSLPPFCGTLPPSMSSFPLRYWSPTTFSSMSTRTIDIIHSRPSVGITIFGTCSNPLPYSPTPISEPTVEHDHAAILNNNVPSSTNAYSRGEAAVSSTFPIQGNSEAIGTTKCKKGRPRKADQVGSSKTVKPRKRRSINENWPQWLPRNWQIISKIRKKGKYVGQVWKTYVSPDGRRFKSRPEVLKKLNKC